MVCFNTSHVTLYQDIVSWCGNSSLFQYISCYSLSQNSCRTEDSLMSFNTSHITLYRSLFRTSSDSSIVSIHLMLLFIGFRTETVISCIWVSIHLMLLFIPLLTSCKWYILCFNTSHVTLYLCKKEKTKEGVKKFQYISCYSLSYSGFLYC